MSEPVPFVDLARSHAPLGADLEAAIGRVVSRGDFILGEDVELFEQEFAAHLGVRHAVGLASGTAAITIALRAAGIGQGDEVIVPAHTYIASALGVVHAGATPVLCDVDPATGLIDLESAAAAVGEQSAALMVVHLYGQACDMDAVGRFADAHGIAVIEDAAQAHGGEWGGRKLGSFGLAAAFSFYPSKNLGAMGDAGMLCTDDGRIAETARWYRNIGQRSKGEHVVAGYNERLDTLQAAVLRVKLPHLASWNESRRTAAAWYRSCLPSAVTALPEREHAYDVYHLFPIRVEDRDRVRERLESLGVATGIHYSPALDRQPPFADPTAAFPAAAGWAAEELTLPMFPDLTEAEVRRVCEALAEAA
jgi:dTDP-4-amino-4,6-dideoxygalactose transaminase